MKSKNFAVTSTYVHIYSYVYMRMYLCIFSEKFAQ